MFGRELLDENDTLRWRETGTDALGEIARIASLIGIDSFCCRSDNNVSLNNGGII